MLSEQKVPYFWRLLIENAGGINTFPEDISSQWYNTYCPKYIISNILQFAQLKSCILFVAEVCSYGQLTKKKVLISKKFWYLCPS